MRPDLVRPLAGAAVACLLAVTLGIAAAEQRQVRRDLLVAAAASLSGIAPALTQAFHDVSGVDVRFNFAGSNTLARQIVEGARVDVFISADEAQMDVVEQAGRLVAGSRTGIVSNQLVLITSGGSSMPARQPDGLASPDVRRIAMGDPAAVPAGVYGRRWLEAVRLWTIVAPKVVPLPSSPGVVGAVAAGRAEIGIVYLSDVVGRAGTQRRTNRDDERERYGDIRIVHRVAAADAPRIVYPAAAITGGRIPFAQQFITFLRSERAQGIFEAAGFRPLAAR